MFSRILSCYHLFQDCSSIFSPFFAAFLMISHILSETQMLLDLLLPLTKYSRFHLWKYCMSVFYFLSSVVPSRYNSWWAAWCQTVSFWGIMLTSAPFIPSPCLSLHRTYFPWFSAWTPLLGFKSQTTFHLKYAFSTLVTLVFPATWIFLFLCPYPHGSCFPSTLYLPLATTWYAKATPFLTDLLISPFSKLL